MILSIFKYYFSVRNLGPKLAVWVSADPAIAKYLPAKKDEKLPGMGGVFNSDNLNVYHYAGLNPVELVARKARRR